GWSGTVKLPGLWLLPFQTEAGVKRDITLMQVQQTLPDIVADFRKFVTHLVDRTGTRVIIGIDELDKIESDGKAQQFLNDIKAVFNLPNTFFLVSVSEDAMARFEHV